MTRALLVLFVVASSASAQTKTPTKQDPKTTVPATKSALPPATKTAPATKAETPAATKTEAPATKAAANPPAPAAGQTKTPAAAPQTPAGATKTAPAPGGTKTGAAATATQGQPGLAVAPEAASRPRTPVILRESFDYDSKGRRDPFFSLLATDELRPSVADLRLVGILYDPSGRRSVVTLRDITTQTRYNVTTGTTLGRMKVVLIKPKAIYFSIEEFGLNRQDSLVLGDTTKVRAK